MLSVIASPPPADAATSFSTFAFRICFVFRPLIHLGALLLSLRDLCLQMWTAGISVLVLLISVLLGQFPVSVLTDIIVILITELYLALPYHLVQNID